MSLSPTILKIFLRKIVKVSSSANLYVSKFLLGNDAIPGIKSFCIYNAPVNKILAESVQFEYPQDDTGLFTTLMISSLKDYKGVLEFLDLASRFIKEDDIRFELVLNAELHEVKRYFSGCDVPSNVVVQTKSADIIPFYKRADLVLNLSRTDQCIETFGLTILEAMAFGIPVIAPPVGGPIELVDDGVTGYLIDSREIDQVVDKIKELSNDPELCLKLSKAAREKAKLFSPDKFKKQILEVLEYVENI
jgi:glycosyltransferase involved in cell wall biosynthesis